MRKSDRGQIFEPAYLALLENNELSGRVEQAYRHLADCDLCARYCYVNRFETVKGAVCRTGGECAAVVKADGYGLGASAVAERLLVEGCRRFFVATVDEGVALRDTVSPSQAEVYVFAGITDASDAGRARQAHLIPVLNHAAQVGGWRRQGGGRCAVHVDTGMARLGFRIDDFLAQDLDGLEVGLVVTHLACADDAAVAGTRKEAADG